jgi:hypothetical protein
MAKKRRVLPKMNCIGPQERRYEGTNERTGVTYYAYFCEGDGFSKVIPDNADFDPSPPIFWSDRNDGCGCTKRRELTDYFDECKKCAGPIYLTPGAAMHRKIAGASYQPRAEYCDSCLDEVVASGVCRNAGCESIGGGALVEGTFGEQLFYEAKQLTFPPNNCEVCRRAIKAFKQRQEIRPTCQLCKKPFRVTYGVMIMILKNEEQCEVPKECLRCRGLSPDERRRVERDKQLEDLARVRRQDVAKVLGGDKKAVQRELARLAEAKEEKRREFLRLLRLKNKLSRKDMRQVLEAASRDKTLLSVLSDPHNIGYRQLQEALAHVTGGRAKMTDKEFIALPQAFRTILKDHPNAMGIFQKAPSHRAPGMSAVAQHYEILSTAALKTGEFRTSSNKSLAIYPTDRVDFGIKFAHGFAQPSQHGTIEADILIHRNSGIIDGLLMRQEKAIAIDAKYTKDDQYSNVPHRQLAGIRNGFNDGKFDEFIFVTNKEFSKDFKKAVGETNLGLVHDYITKHNQDFRSEELKFLTAEERAAMPAEIVELSRLSDLKEYTQAVKEFAERYDIDQIEVCEYVK